MSVVCQGKVTQDPSGSPLTFTDTSTGLGTVSSRILVITDPYGNVLDTINMGSSLTAVYLISTDQYLSFTETIVDNAGTYTCTVNYLSTDFYELAFAPAVASQSCACDDVFGVLYNLNRAELFKEAAIIFAQRGVGVNAQLNITEANFLVKTPYYA